LVASERRLSVMKMMFWRREGNDLAGEEEKEKD